MFKVGDVLIIKDTEDNQECFKGRIGTQIVVSKVDAINHVWFINQYGDEHGGWRVERFVPAYTETTDAANYYHAIVGYSNAESVS